jgi:transposase-like protein
MRSNETIIKYYQAECALKHKHRIEVSYNSEQETFEISKEMPATKEEIEEAEREIMEILKETCNFCDKQVERMELAGFRHPSGMPFKDQSPICQDC